MSQRFPKTATHTVLLEQESNDNYSVSVPALSQRVYRGERTLKEALATARWLIALDATQALLLGRVLPPDKPIPKRAQRRKGIRVVRVRARLNTPFA
ncbi:MAG: hypothetical protein Q7S96_04545 [bacterium]|nr:hypothetical protein [bacterium]